MKFLKISDFRRNFHGFLSEFRSRLKAHVFIIYDDIIDVTFRFVFPLFVILLHVTDGSSEYTVERSRMLACDEFRGQFLDESRDKKTAPEHEASKIMARQAYRWRGESVNSRADRTVN